VLDSGTDLDHPDLASKLRTNIDWDFVRDDSVADEEYGHGTHVSGIAAAATDNGVGVAGMGWDAQILPLKVLDDQGNGWGDDIANAIYYAADNGAHVINLSLGTRIAVPCPQYMQDAVDYAYDRDVVVVAAAGNEYTHMEIFPANCEHVLGVAATDQSDNRASYSNYGDHVSIAAPGSGIYSTGWTDDGETNCTSGYCYKSGTSMATPHVAGLAALVRALYPSYTPDQVASAILDNAVDRGTAGWDQYYGCGRIDAFEALSKGAQDTYPVCLQGVTIWSNDVQREPTSAPFAPGEIIVSFRPGIQAEQAAQQYGDGAELLPALGAWRLRVPAGQERAALAELRADPAVVYAELNYLAFAQ
jgi:subtilisin family serine protease